MATINNDTLAILSRVTIVGNNIELTCGQLDRKQYEAVNKVMANIGGKWNRKAKAHVFDSDPTDLLENVLLTGETTKPEKFGYFPTPPELAQYVVDLACIEEHHKAIEPSAGQGALADLIAAKTSKVLCIELQACNFEVLIGKGHAAVCSDFMTEDIDMLVDRIVMNPPFEKQADIDHVEKAWSLLAPGGKLVSIMSASVSFRENKKSVAFRELIEEFGYYEANPEGSFKPSGTAVNTITVVLDKPE